MHRQEYPDLTRFTSTMASNQAKIGQYIETLTGRVDGLVSAAQEEDWERVRQISGEIAEEGRRNGYRSISAMAQRVYDQAHHPADTLGVKRSLIRLIGTCGRAESDQAFPSAQPRNVNEEAGWVEVR